LKNLKILLQTHQRIDFYRVMNKNTQP